MTVIPHDNAFNKRRLPDQIGPVHLVCPSCEAPVGVRVRIVIESIRAAAKHPALPEMLMTCPCGEVFVVALWPQSPALGARERS